MVTWIRHCFHNRRNRFLLKFPGTSPRKRKIFMSWSTTTIWVKTSMRRLLLVCVAVCIAGVSLAQDLHVPTSAVAGNEATIATTGSGNATFYLLGPGVSRKNDLNLGADIHIPPQDLRNAGHYLAVLCSGTCRSASFYVNADRPASLAFLVHPSRVAVSLGDAVSGVALPFDHYHNLVLAPVGINFQIAAGTTSLFSRP